MRDSLKAIANEQAKQEMNTYIQLIYAGNAVLYPSALLDFKMFVGGKNFVSSGNYVPAVSQEIAQDLRQRPCDDER